MLADLNLPAVRATKISEADLSEILTGQNYTGLVVDDETAKKISAVGRCVRVLAESVAQTPLFLYRRTDEDEGKEKATRHPAYELLHRQANPWMTAFDWRETAMGHIGYTGNHYSRLVRGPDGIGRELWPLDPRRVTWRVENDVKSYTEITGSGKINVYAADQILHLHWFSDGGFGGRDVMVDGQEIFGLANAIERYAGEFYANEGTPSGLIKYPGKLGTAGFQRLLAWWKNRHSRWGKKASVGILEEGAEWQQIGVSPEVARLIEGRTFQVQDIARFYGIPVHMVNELSRATFSNIEEQSIEFVVYTLQPWFVRIATSMTLQILPTQQQQEYLAEFDPTALQRGDIQNRFSAYSTAVQAGFMSANDVRKRESMNPLDEEIGDNYLRPLNMVVVGEEDELDESTEDNEPATEPDDDQNEDTDEEGRARPSAAVERHRLGRSLLPTIESVIKRVVKREKADIDRQVRKVFVTRDARQEIDQWLENYYRDHADWVGEQMGPVFLTARDLVIEQMRRELGVELDAGEIDRMLEDFIDKFAESYSANSLGQLRGLLRRTYEADGDPITTVQQRLQEWTERRPRKVAIEESVRTINAVAVAGYTASGVVRRLQWVTFGRKNCPYCTQLSGNQVDIGGHFAHGSVDAGDRPLQTYGRVKHPPIHGGCDCQLIGV